MQPSCPQCQEESAHEICTKLAPWTQADATKTTSQKNDSLTKAILFHNKVNTWKKAWSSISRVHCRPHGNDRAPPLLHGAAALPHHQVLHTPTCQGPVRTKKKEKKSVLIPSMPWKKNVPMTNISPPQFLQAKPVSTGRGRRRSCRVAFPYSLTE